MLAKRLLNHEKGLFRQDANLVRQNLIRRLSHGLHEINVFENASRPETLFGIATEFTSS